MKKGYSVTRRAMYV